jgi:sec-independent protein translocase protein TatA
MNHPVLLFLNLGGSEIGVIMLFVLLFFGADKMPELARGLGKGVRQFKDAMNGLEEEVKKAATSVDKEVQKTLNEAEVTEPTKPNSSEASPITNAPEAVKGTVAKSEDQV